MRAVQSVNTHTRPFTAPACDGTPLHFTLLATLATLVSAAGVDMNWANRLRSSFRYYPQAVLDVGANVGLWTTMARRVWPNASFQMVEANPALRPRLEKIGVPVEIAILGNESKPVQFFMAKKGAFHADKGSSLFREQANAHNFEAVTVQQRTLDELFYSPRQHHSSTPYQLLKVDAQGAELLILQGGRRMLAAVDVIVLELSVGEYNLGGPAWFEVHQGVDQLGFRAWDVSEQHRGAHGVLLQLDVIFVKKGHALWAKRPQDGVHVSHPSGGGSGSAGGGDGGGSSDGE